MKTRIALLFFFGALMAACDKGNNVPKIPHISLLAVMPEDSMRVNIDTCAIMFSLVDGDGDLGNDAVSAIYLKDSRYEAQGFVPTPFPPIDPSIEDPKKGLEGTCIFFPVPQPEPRLDSVHLINGDTLVYELYIKDRAGNESNHITTHPIIVKP